MASCIPGEAAKHAARRFYFTLSGRRHAIRFPAMTWNSALTVLHRLEDLVNAKIAGTAPKSDTVKWLATLDESIHKRLAATGLIGSRASALLGEFLKAYIESRTDVQDSTKRKWNSTHKSLLKIFGAHKPLRDITPGDAERWRRNLEYSHWRSSELAKKPRRKFPRHFRRTRGASTRLSPRSSSTRP